jgi:hypothetical protein
MFRITAPLPHRQADPGGIGHSRAADNVQQNNAVSMSDIVRLQRQSPCGRSLAIDNSLIGMFQQ